MLLGRLRTHQPAVGAQQRELAGHARGMQLVAQVGNIFAHHRPHRGVGDGRQRALIFLHFGQDLVAERDRDVLHHLARDFADAFLVRAVDVGIDQADGDRLDAGVLQRPQLRADLVLVQRTDLVAVGVHSAGNGNRVLERGERLGFGPHDPCRQSAGHEAARDLHDIAIALGHDQPDARALPFEHGVGRDRRAVEEELDLGRIDARFLRDRSDPGEDPFRAVCGSRWRLLAPEFARFVVEQQEVGERAPHIDAQPIAHQAAVLSVVEFSGLGKPPALPTIAGRSLSITPASQRLVSISWSRSSPVAIPARSSM